MEVFDKKLIKPLVVFWELTRKCNLRCSHCYTSSGATGFQLSKEKLLKILNIICSNDIFSLGLGGGEPLLVRETDEIISLASENDIDVTLSTNGLLLSKERALQLKECGLKIVQVSIDGDEKTHDRIRGKGSYRKAINAIANAKSVGLIARVGMTINQLNYLQTEEVFNTGMLNGADWFIAFRYMSTGRVGDKLSLDSSQLRAATKTLLKLQKKFENKVFFEKLVFFPFLVDDNEVSLKACNAGKSIMNITANGDVTPCPHVPTPIVGNILKDNFSTIWNSKEMQMDCLLDKNCLSCIHVSYCLGGCKGVIVDGKKDSLCWI